MGTKQRELVIVALSGGVDSAVAAKLLLDAGYDVQCLHMTNWEDDGYCDAAGEYQDARAVCRHLGVPLHRVNFAREYAERVFDDFLTQYGAGRTPNADVLCNREIKFGLLLEYARRLGTDRIATGHYARLERGADGVRLLKGVDSEKDQSYFLHQVPAAQFERVLFPLGRLTKREVREIAVAAGLPVATKKDSFGLCFIGQRPFAEFLSRYVDARPGPIRTLQGRTIGRHRGLPYYTLGQRQGLEVGGVADAAEAPWYVASKSPADNALIVVQGHDHPRLFKRRLATSPAHWINGPPARAAPALRCAAKTRYRQPDQACAVRLLDSGRLDVEFDEPQRAPAPGQYLVLYAGERCLGGAAIVESEAPTPAEAVPAG